MSKRTNTILFLVGATIFNILVTIAAFLVLIVLYGRVAAPLLPAGAAVWGLPVVFAAAIAIAFVAYRLAVKALLSKHRAEDLFGPLNSRRKGND